MERYCAAYSLWRECQKFIRANGRTYEAANKYGDKSHRPYPEVGMLAKTGAELHRLSQEFGLTAASRARLATGKEDERDEMLTLLQGRFGDRTG